MDATLTPAQSPQLPCGAERQKLKKPCSAFLVHTRRHRSCAAAKHFRCSSEAIQSETELRPDPQPSLFSGPSLEAGAIQLQARRRCRVIDLSDRLTPYKAALEWQRKQVQRRKAALERRERRNEARQPDSPGDGDEADDDCDVLLLLQHPPVFTLGTRSDRRHLLFLHSGEQGGGKAAAGAERDTAEPCARAPGEGPETGGCSSTGFQGGEGMGRILGGAAEVVETERGGEVTYHGPGQLVLYPLLDLRSFRPDLHWYLRSLEEVLITALQAPPLCLPAERQPGFTGVWCGDSKVAAIGVRVTRWLSFHGAALNVCTDLAPFSAIRPCGLERPVGSVRELLQAAAGGPGGGAVPMEAPSIAEEVRFLLYGADGTAWMERNEMEGREMDAELWHAGVSWEAAEEDKQLMAVVKTQVLASFEEVFQVALT